ncbi:MAG TPA: AraC family transcriptional regulator [Bradyrhizobium sp.]|nr:AraC family transcriptional regulator [Bradyrhizobium sp.]
MPAPVGERSEMAHRTTTSELFQAGHFHDHAQIVAVFAGWRSFATPSGTIRAEAGDILAIPSGMFHAPGNSDKSSVLVLFLDKDHPVARGIRRPSVTNGQGAKHLDEILDRVATRMAGHQTTKQLQMSSMLTNLVTQDESSLRDVAETLGYSHDGFTRAFCRCVGTTPAKYRIAHRLTMARSMIREGAMLADAAFATGFSDQSHLGRCFLRAFGTTPAAYRSGLLAPA